MAEIEYSDKSVSVERPSEKRSTVVVYARPGDTINLAFSVNDGKLSFVSSDIVFTFGDGSQVVVASMGSLAFSENPPKMYDSAGTLIDLEEILKRAEQIKVTDALLILTTNDEYTLVELEEEVKEVVSASNAEEEGVGGSPDEGGGPLKVETRGHISNIYDPLGEVDDYNTLTGIGPATLSDGETNYAFNSDEEYTLPGEIPLPKKKSIEVMYSYGDEANKYEDPVNIGGTDHEYYNFISKGGYSDDPLIQVQPVTFDINGTSPVFFNSRYEGDRVNRNFTIKYKTVVPTEIRISGLPDVVSISLVDESSGVLTKQTDKDGHNVWYINNITSYQKIDLQMNYAQGISYSNRSLSIDVDYYDGDKGRGDTIEFKQVISFKPIKSAEELESSTTTILSSTPPGVNINIENGGLSDIVVGGSAGNTIRTTGGEDFVFSEVGDDLIYLGTGDDTYFASSGTDYVAGGNGNDIAYYDDNMDGEVSINDPSNYLGDAYDTFSNQGSVDGYIGYLNYESILATYGVSLDKDFPEIQEDDILFFSSGVQVYDNFEQFYLSQGNDRIFVNDDYIDTSKEYIFNTGSYGDNGTDSIYFSDAENAIIVNIGGDEIIYGATGEGKIIGTSGFDLIEATTKDDTFNLDISGVKEDSITLVGGAGTDVINGSASGAFGLVFNFVDYTIVKDAAVASTVVYFDEIEEFVGSEENDTFYGASSSISYTLDGAGGTDILSYEKSYQGVTFSEEDGEIYKTVNFTSQDDLEGKSHDNVTNFEEKRASNRGDIFLLSDVAQNFDNVDGLGGDDKVDASYVTGPVTFAISSSGTASYGSNTLHFVDVEVLLATANDDVFQVALDDAIETSFIIDGAEGSDTLNFAGTDNIAKIDFTRNRATTRTVADSAVSIFITFSNVERFIGSDKDDTFFLSDKAIAEGYYLDGGANDIGTYDTMSFEKITVSDSLSVDVNTTTITLGSENVSFINFEGVIGTKNDDTFVAGGISFKFDGSGGVDTIDYSSISGSVTFDQDAKTVEKSDYSGADDYLANVERILATKGNDLFKGSYYGVLEADGNDGTDTLKYENAKNSLTFNIDETITINKGVNTDTITRFEKIYGGQSTDKFILSNGAIDHGVSNIELHGGADDTVISQNELDLTAFDSIDVSVDVFSQGGGLVNADGVDFSLYNFYKIDLSDNADTITFAAGSVGSYNIKGGDGDGDVANYRAISSVIIQINDNGLSVTRESSGKDSLTGFEKIVATDGNDTISFSATKDVDVEVDLLNGYDTINFADFRGESVTFDFGTDVTIAAVNSSGATINVVFSGAESFAGANLVTDNIFNIHEEIMGYTSSSVEPIVIAGQSGSSANSVVNFIGFSSGITLNFLDGILNYGSSSLFVSFKSITSFVLTSGSDTIINQVNSNTSFDGGSGTDTADYSNVDSAVTVDVANGKVVKEANLTVDNYVNVEKVVGTQKSDTFIVGDSSGSGTGTSFSSLDGGDEDDYLSFENSPNPIKYDKGVLDAGGALASITISNIENLKGSDGDDVFIIASGETLKQYDGAGDTKASGGVGDTITFEGDVEYKALGLSVVVVNGGINYSFDNMENIAAGSGDQTYFGSSAVNIRFDGGDGYDVISYETVLFGVTFDLSNKQIVKDNSGVNVDEFDNVEKFVGTDSTDVFKISDGGYSPSGIITLDGGDSDDYLDFSNIANASVDIDTVSMFYGVEYDLTSIESYQFGDTDDVANIIDATQGYNIFMYGGDDTVSYSNLSDTSIALDIQYDSFSSGLVVNKSGVMDSISMVENVVGTQNDDVLHATADMTDMNFDGSGGTDEVTYEDDQDAIEAIFNGNTATIQKGGKDTDLDSLPDTFSGTDTVSNVEMVIGSNNNDVFVISAKVPSVNITIDGGGGTDFLSFRDFASPIIGDLASLTIAGYTAINFESIEGTIYDDVVTISSDTSNIGFAGNNGKDTLIFDSSSSGNWGISIDLINNTATRTSGGSFVISNVEKYELTDQDDTVRMSQEAIDNRYAINGGDGSDIANYEGVDLSSSVVSIGVSALEINGTKSVENFEQYHFDTVGELHWNISGVDVSKYTISAANADLYFDVGDVTVDHQALEFTSTNFTNGVMYSNTIAGFHFSGGNNTFIATNLEKVTVAGSTDKSAVDTLDLSSVTAGVVLLVESGSDSGATGNITRGGQQTETFSDIDKIILTSSSDNLTLTEFSVSSGQEVVIDGGAGTDSVAIITGSGGVEIDVNGGGGGMTSSSYIFKNIENSSLSEYSDIVHFTSLGVSNNLDGRDGQDTADYSKYDIRVSLQISEIDGKIKSTTQRLASDDSITGTDFLVDFEKFTLGSKNDRVSVQTPLAQEVIVDGGAGNNQFYYLGSDFTAAGPMDMSIEGKGNFTVGELSVSNFQEIYLETLTQVNFNIDLDKADGFQLFLSQNTAAIYTFNFTSSSTIVFDNVAHTFSNSVGNFSLETHVYNLDFGASDVELNLGVDQIFQNMSFASSGNMEVNLQNSSVRSINLDIDGNSSDVHASLQLNSSYVYEFTTKFTMNLTTDSKISIADSAANTAYVIKSDTATLKPTRVNYTLEYGAEMSSMFIEDKQDMITYGAMSLALGNSVVHVTETGDVNFKFGSDMDASSYEYRRYNIVGYLDFASLNITADSSSQFVTSAGAFNVSVIGISADDKYVLSIYDEATGDKDLEFIVEKAQALSFSGGSAQDIDVGVDVENFTLNEGFNAGSGGRLDYGILGDDVTMTYNDGAWTDIKRNNLLTFAGDFYFDASSMGSGSTLTLSEMWNTSDSVEIDISGVEGKNIQLDVESTGSNVVLSFADNAIALTEGGATSSQFLFDINVVEHLSINVKELTSINLSLDFFNNINANIITMQDNATNIIFQGSTKEEYFVSAVFSASGAQFTNLAGYTMDFNSSVGVDSVVFDNPDARLDLTFSGNDFGGSDNSLDISGSGYLEILTLDKGAYINLPDKGPLTIEYNGSSDKISIDHSLWYRNNVLTEINLSPEPDILEVMWIGTTTLDISAVDFGDKTLATEDRIVMTTPPGSVAKVEIKLTEDFSTIITRSDKSTPDILVATNVGVVNSITTDDTAYVTVGEHFYVFEVMPDASMGDLDFYVTSDEHLSGAKPKAKSDFVAVKNVGAMSVTIAADSGSPAGWYVDTVADSTGGKGNIILKNVSIFSLSQNVNTGINNSVSQGDLNNNYVFDNSLSATSMDYDFTFSGNIDVSGNTVIKKDGSGSEKGRDMILGSVSRTVFLHNGFNIDLTDQSLATTIVMDGRDFAFSDVKATELDDILVINAEIYEGFEGEDRYAVFDMAGGNDVLFVDDINNDLALGRNSASFSNLDVSNAMSVEEGGKGIFIDNVETVSFDSAYANVYVGAYAQNLNFVSEESTTVFIESEKMDVSFKFMEGGVISFENLDSQNIIFSAENDNYSFNGSNLEVEGEFDLVGTKGDDIFEINGDNISSLQSIDGLSGTDTLDISGSIKSASEFSDKVTNINRLVFNDMDTNTIDLSIEDIMQIKGEQEELLIDVQDSDFNVNIIDDNSDYSYTLARNAGYMTYTLFDSNSQEVGKVVVNDNAGLDEDGIYMQGSDLDDELTVSSQELKDATSIDGGEGFDTLEISGSVADMGSLVNKANNIEKIVISDMEEASANLNIEDVMNMTDDENKLVIDIEDESFDLNIINDGSDYSYSVKSDDKYDVYTVYSDENQKDEVGQIIVNHNHNNGNHH